VGYWFLASVGAWVEHIWGNVMTLKTWILVESPEFFALQSLLRKLIVNSLMLTIYPFFTIKGEKTIYLLQSFEDVAGCFLVMMIRII
jgi:hypothetical protein